VPTNGSRSSSLVSSARRQPSRGAHRRAPPADRRPPSETSFVPDSRSRFRCATSRARSRARAMLRRDLRRAAGSQARGRRDPRGDGHDIGRTAGRARTHARHDIVANYTIINHDSRDDSSLAYLGETKAGAPIYLNKKWLAADVRITTDCGSRTSSPASARRQDGRPGLAGLKTVLVLHDAGASAVRTRLASSRHPVQTTCGRLRGQPAYVLHRCDAESR